MQTMETVQGQGSVPSVMQLPETEEFRTYHQPEGIAAQEAAPFPTSAITPSLGGEQLYQHESVGPYPVPAAENNSSATLSAALDRPQQALAPAEQQTPPHSEPVPNLSTPLTSESEAAPAETDVSEQGPDRKQLGPPQTPFPHLDIPPTFEPEHYTPPQQDVVSQSEAAPPPTTNPERLASPQQHPIQNTAVGEARMTPPQYSSHPKFGFDTHPPPGLTPVEPQSAPVSDFNNMQLTQNVGESGGQLKASLGGQTGSQEEVPIGSGQPASLQEQQEGQAVPTAYEGYQSQESAQPYSGQQVSTGSGGGSGSQLNFQPFSIVGADADTWSHYKVITFLMWCSPHSGLTHRVHISSWSALLCSCCWYVEPCAIASDVTCGTLCAVLSCCGFVWQDQVSGCCWDWNSILGIRHRCKAW